MADFDGVVSQRHPELRRDPRMSGYSRQALVMGMSGVGKTTIVNMLFNNGYGVDDCNQPGKVGCGSHVVTEKAEVVVSKHGFLLCDSTGLSNPRMSDEDVFRQVHSIFKTVGKGPTTLIMVVRFGRWTSNPGNDHDTALALFDKFFKRTWRRQSILVLTHYEGRGRSKESEFQAWKAHSPEVQKMVESFAHVIMTDNCIATGFQEVSRAKRRQCLVELTGKIRAWSQPITLEINSFSDFIGGVFGFLRPARSMPLDGLGSVQESPPGIVARKTELTDRLTALKSSRNQLTGRDRVPSIVARPTDLPLNVLVIVQESPPGIVARQTELTERLTAVESRVDLGDRVRSAESTDFRKRLEALEQNHLSTRTDAPVPVSQTSNTWRLGQPRGAGQSTVPVQHAGNTTDVFESLAYKKVRMRLIRTLDMSEVRITAEGCGLIRSTQVDRLSRVSDRLDHNRELFRIMEVGGKQALKTFSQHVLAEMGDHYRADRATLDNLLSHCQGTLYTR